VDIIGGVVQLKKQQQLQRPLPFHKEKTPSFVVRKKADIHLFLDAGNR
jgi:DNA primase